MISVLNEVLKFLNRIKNIKRTVFNATHKNKHTIKDKPTILSVSPSIGELLLSFNEVKISKALIISLCLDF